MDAGDNADHEQNDHDDYNCPTQDYYVDEWGQWQHCDDCWGPRWDEEDQSEDTCQTGLPKVNVLKFRDATVLQERLVKDSRPLLRDDIPIEQV